MGAEAFTNSTGDATLAFAARPGVLERLYAFADRGFWSALRLSIPTSAAMQLDLTPIDLSQVHPLRHYFGEPALTQGSGVNVGVIDTGSGPHPDLVITNGFNAVTGEVPTQFGDNGDLHGTHVAGIIGSRGSAPNGVRGIAPGVTLFSYRVFPKGSNASNFDIANAIDKAREQGCDLINLSLGRPAGGTAPDEPLVRVALEDARAAGMLAIAAAGNDFRRGVSFPAADDLCIVHGSFSGDPAPRMHRVRRDGSRLECLYEHRNDEFIVHETFLGTTGDLVFTVWPRKLCRMDWSTRQITTIADYNAWHIAPDRAGRRVLCDTNHPDNGIQIVSVADGTRTLVCRSDSSNRGSQWLTSRYALKEDFERARAGQDSALSWMEADNDTVYGPQCTHPHPSWSRDETQIVFTSDRTGVPQVYVADIP